MYLYTFTYLQIIRFGYKDTSYEYFIFISYNFLIFLYNRDFLFSYPFRYWGYQWKVVRVH